MAEEISVTVDGVKQKDLMITLINDGAEHNVQVANVVLFMIDR
jgi:hypothetical protein